jgi:hypothetical protein
MRLFSRAAIVFALIGAVISISSQANASATGCDNRQLDEQVADPNAISREITFPYGYLCHLIHTNGKLIEEQKAAYTASAGIYAPLVDNICNWKIDFVYYDTNGDEYMRDEGDIVSDCKQGVSRKVADVRELPKYGTTCAELIVDGEKKFTQCHILRD